MRKLFYFGAAIAALALSAAMTLPASASTGGVLTYGSLGGSSVAAGDTITASLAAGTNAEFYTTSTGTSGLTCGSSSFDATVVTNPAASGAATESLTGQTFGSCSASVFGVTSVQSLTVNNLPWSASVDDSTDTLTISGTSSAPIETTVVLNTLLGQATCVYEANGDAITGTVSNSANSISFSNQQFNLVSGTFLCAGNGYFSATYSPVEDSTQGNAAVYVN